jgi:hypothetical protein
MWDCNKDMKPIQNRTPYKLGWDNPGRSEGGRNGVGTWELPGPPKGKDIREALGDITLACPGSKVLTGFSLVRRGPNGVCSCTSSSDRNRA